ncbi:MAG: glycine cleavage system aminomethyltransferase GcvT [Candidatus Omnitrophica bacterium]|nr:glycine cleavage system aminomethyltransferase GcvT [Candidatus Omnitrophota bacterium]
MENAQLKYTPLLSNHKQLSARLGPFGGWMMPIQYKGIIAEHNWTRQSASLFDICHMGEFLIRGTARDMEKDLCFTSNLALMPVGGCRYGFILNESGGIIDDLVAYRMGEDEWMFVVNAATKDNDLAYLRQKLPPDISIEDISDKTAKLDIQGPLSSEIMKALAGDGINALGYYKHGRFELIGCNAVISRTGYTGELGFEIYADSRFAQQLWQAILADERVRPAGLGARDTLRLEMCYPLYGQDIDESTTPLEAGFEVFLDLKKDFIGKPALLKQRCDGLQKRLIVFTMGTRQSPRHGDKIYIEEKEAGYVTSGSFAPSLGIGVGMGYVENGYDWIGARVLIKNERFELPARITDKPFYRKGTLRK